VAGRAEVETSHGNAPALASFWLLLLAHARISHMVDLSIVIANNS
jgi:hypothetical protein